MKRLVQFFSVIVLGISPLYSQNVNIPDTTFLNALIQLGIDNNNDSLISYVEAEAVTELFVLGTNISDMTGIEAFVNLNQLDCYGNQLTSLDVSKNTELIYLYCFGNQLTSLDVSNNTALTALSCADNQLTSLDVSSCIALQDLQCDYNQLTSLDVSQNTDLTVLTCSWNQLTSLDVSNNTALKELDCGYNQLTSLDVSNNTALPTLSCCGNQLTSLDVSNHPALEYLDCSSNQLTSLDVSKNIALYFLGCSWNQLTSLDVSKNTALYYLYISGMPNLYEVCVWTKPFPPEGVNVSTWDNPHVYFTTDCIPTISASETLYQPNYIAVASSKNGMIYLVPEGTEKDLANICAVCLDSAIAVENVWSVISLDGFDNGEYWLYARNEYSTLSQPKQFTIMGVGIADKISNQLRIYPNPVNEILTIHSGTSGEYSIQITSLNGQLVYSASMEGDTHRIDMSPFREGVYFITVKSKDFVTTRKIIKL